MNQPTPLSLQFRHIVFPDRSRRRPAQLNLTPAAEAVPAPAEPPALNRESAAFVTWLFARAGLEARAYRVETLQRRLPACLRALRTRTPAQARCLLEEKPCLVGTALNSMLVGVTSFFRDPDLFEALEKQLIPELGRGRPGIHVWSAGCSEGAELYSLGIIFAELDLSANSYLLGTDCRPDAIQRAREGWYDSAALKHVPADRAARYFQRDGPGRRVVPALRYAVRWRVADVLRALEPGLWDIILFRNTAMYLRGEATAALWEKFEASLRPGGLLVLGKSERPAGARRLTQVKPCVYRRQRGCA